MSYHVKRSLACHLKERQEAVMIHVYCSFSYTCLTVIWFKITFHFICLIFQLFAECSNHTHQFQAECASVGWGVVHGTVTLFVPHSGVSIVPQQVLHTPDARTKKERKDKENEVVLWQGFFKTWFNCWINQTQSGAYFPSVSVAAA